MFDYLGMLCFIVFGFLKLTPTEDVLLNANWIKDDTMRLDIRWLEVCRTRWIEFKFTDEVFEIVSTVKKVGGFDLLHAKVFAIWD